MTIISVILVREDTPPLRTPRVATPCSTRNVWTHSPHSAERCVRHQILGVHALANFRLWSANAIHNLFSTFSRKVRSTSNSRRTCACKLLSFFPVTMKRKCHTQFVYTEYIGWCLCKMRLENTGGHRNLMINWY